MGRMNKLTLLRAGIAISSSKIYLIKEIFPDFEKKLDKLLYSFTPQNYFFEMKRNSKIIQS